ncbi:uncharacterized protein LOC133351834 isoform X3 [Lethenteron reissneri]|uniref:uncharacterized protein LOC133351834 isoform X3 n=1 Tax=Lethenteron reissneri TaxID=7753 RepID=UPI002AB5F643|nr:uncharacterized protein LOC133351834 isoform X3 [Lethenteron reissneri]
MSLLAGRRSVPTTEEKTTGETTADDATVRGGNKEGGFGSDDRERIGADEEKGEGRREEPRQGERRRGGPCGEDDGGGGRDCQGLGERFLCRHFARGEGCVMGDAGPESEDQVVMFLAGVLGRMGHGPHQPMQTELREMAFTSTNSQDVKPALVLCSPPRLLAWAEALERRGAGCRAVVVDGAESAGALAGLLHGGRHHEVAVATYATARLHLHEMNSVQWSMVIVEEPQQPGDQDGEAEPWPPKGQEQHCDSGPLAPREGPWPAQSGHHAVPPCPVGASATSNFHNPWIRDWRTLRAIRCPVRIGLAATTLRSSLVDLWSIVDWAVPGSLGSIGEFREEFASPIETARRHSATGRERRRAQVATAGSCSPSVPTPPPPLLPPPVDFHRSHHRHAAPQQPGDPIPTRFMGNLHLPSSLLTNSGFVSDGLCYARSLGCGQSQAQPPRLGTRLQSHVAQLKEKQIASTNLM